MTLHQSLQAANITCAHIIDDAFDRLPTEPFPVDEAQTLVDSLDAQNFEKICNFLDCKNEAELIDAFQDLDKVRLLFKKRGNFSPYCDEWFDAFLDDRKEKRAMVQPLITLLKNNGLKCITFGADYAIKTGTPEPQLVFIDLRLINIGQTSTEAAVKAYKKLKQHFDKCVPFVFLMSSLTSLGEHRDKFWEEAGVFLTQFDSISKDIFKDKSELSFILRTYSNALPRIRSLHQHIEQLECAIAAAGKRVREKVRSLDVADYFVLHRNTVAAEETDLGTYMSELLLEYTLFEIEGSAEIWQFAKDLQEWELKDLPRARFNLKPAALDIYRGNVLHANALMSWESTRLKGPEQGYFHLGDIYFKASEMDNAKSPPKQALILLTPVCDLARPDELRKRSMFLCEGKVEKVKQSSDLISHDKLPNIIVPNPSNSSEQLLIKWNKKKFHVWSTKEMDSFSTMSPVWKRIGRLRPLYALQLQQSLVSDMSRIGTQRAPDRLIPHGIEILIAKNGKWHTLDKESLKDNSAAATAPSADGSRILYIIDDAVIGRVRRTLGKWIKDHPRDFVSRALKNIIGQAQWSEKLLYCSHEIPQEEGKSTKNKDAFPMGDLAGVKSEYKEAVVFTTNTHNSAYSSVSGGTERDPKKQPAYLVFKLVRPA